MCYVSPCIVNMITSCVYKQTNLSDLQRIVNSMQKQSFQIMLQYVMSSFLIDAIRLQPQILRDFDGCNMHGLNREYFEPHKTHFCKNSNI